jgi:hypothetical protein
MKKILLIILFFLSIAGFGQDTLKIKQIELLVNAINSSKLKPQYDTIIRNMPEMGLFMKTYLTVIADSSGLKKFVNAVYSENKDNGKTIILSGSTTFYFDESKLIKAEDFAVQDGNEKHAEWYYADDKPLYYTQKSERSEERATLLLTMSQAMLKQFQAKK